MKRYTVIFLSVLVSRSVYSATPPPTHFPGCQADKVVYFTYTYDSYHAVEWCNMSDGWRFSYGHVADKNQTTSFMLSKNKILAALKRPFERRRSRHHKH